MKKHLMTLAVAGLVLTGCTKNEAEGYDIPDPDVIAFSSNTSRAPINNLQTLMDNAGGFTVYGVVKDGTGWYTNVDGTNNYHYDNSNWGWAGAEATWPTDDGDYPMTFYAMYPAAVAGTPGSMSSSVTIAATAATQVDLLAAKASAPIKPASGKLSLVFDHILSKVNFGVIPGHNMKPEILLVKINNVNNNNTYNYISHSWGSATTGTEDYVYYQNTTPPLFSVIGGTSEDAAFPIYPVLPAADPADPDAVAAVAAANTAAANANLMLMPQAQGSGANEPWDVTDASSATSTLATNSYIEVIYRITDVTVPATPADYVGFTNASDYIYPGYVNNITWGNYTNGLGDGSNDTYNGAFYVRAGFPVTVTWVQGKGYVYNICLGTADSTNGQYIDATYYDDQGNNTGVPIRHGDIPVTPGEPVTSGVINFLVGVSDWDNDGGTTPLR